MQVTIASLSSLRRLSTKRACGGCCREQPPTAAKRKLSTDFGENKKPRRGAAGLFVKRGFAIIA
jgi:hypothetical protein